MSTVKEMLDIKGRDVVTIGAADSVYESVEKMAEVQVGALPVLDDDGCLVGIISERDYARKVILKNKSARDTSVSDIMTRDVVVAREDTTVEKCMALMTHKKIRHLPIVEGQDLVGIIAVGDLLKFTIKQQSMTIEELQSFIMEETGGSG
ncbi:MAG TPA: histidine kinase [Gammaproteobacteria bacterium]|nr:histidine kinase [Gammaproteobacteria bacterium]